MSNDSLRFPSETKTSSANLSFNRADIDALVQVARDRRRMVAFTGAGISTESGIPDYRGPNGVWQRQTPLTYEAFRTDPETRRNYWERRRTGYATISGALPNSGHRALETLERAGHLAAIITQNIDGLHQKAGSDPGRVIELHGTTHTIICTCCGREYPSAEIQDWLLTNDGIPSCSNCGGMLRPATILFGESLSEPVWQRAVATAADADLLLIVGSSLVVNPAASLPLIAKQAGAAVAIVNRTPTQLDAIADVVVSADAGPALSALAAGLAERDAAHGPGGG